MTNVYELQFKEVLMNSIFRMSLINLILAFNH